MSAPTQLTVNGRANPIGIETAPRFGWQPPSARQIAYEVAVGSAPDAADVLHTGRVDGDASQGVTGALVLASATRYFWRVRTWDEAGTASEWSADAFFETGLLGGEPDWAGARWIGGRQPQDHDWRNSTTTVRFAGSPGTPLTVLLRAEPIGKKWDEALAWTVGPSIAGNTRLARPVATGATTLPVADVRHWRAGDAVRIQLAGREFRTTVAAVGTSDVDDVVTFPFPAPTVVFLATDPGVAAGEPLTIGSTPVTITAVNRVMAGCVVAFDPPLAAPAAEGTLLRRLGTGIRLHDPLPEPAPAGAAVRGESVLRLEISTRHYAGNTGVPDGIPPVVWGENYYDPQSETNPVASGGREVPAGRIDIPVAAGLTHDNWSDEHELVVRLDEDTATTWLDRTKIDSRRLTGDERRSSGSVGFAAGSTATIRTLTVIGDRGGVDVDFRTGANPLERGSAGPDGLRIDGGNAMLPIANPAPLLRKEFDLPDGGIRAARLYATAGGQYELTVNGRALTVDGGPAAGDGSNVPRLLPDHTNFDRTVLYNTFDVTAAVHSGRNVLAAELGRGWYGLTTPTEWYWNLTNYQGDPRLRLKLVVTLTDGTTHAVVTDGTWETIDGPTTFDSVYSGEKFDARRADDLAGWRTGNDRSEPWQRATVMAAPGHNPCGHGRLPATREEPGFVPARLRAHEAEPVLPNEVRRPQWIRPTFPGSGVYVADFGQILTGFPTLALDGVPASARGVTVRLRGGNAVAGDGTADSPLVVDEENQFHDADLQTNYYTVGSATAQEWTSRFTHWGFRYVELRNVEAAVGRPLEPDDAVVRVEVARSGFARTGRFTTDSPLLNRIRTNLEWAEQNNLIHKPTDTPSREKNGWSGDAMASSESQSLTWDVDAQFTKYLRDFPDAQASTGQLPMILPAAKGGFGYDHTPGWDLTWSAVPAWDSALFVMPAELDLYYGNDTLYAELYPAQERLFAYYSTLFTAANDYRFTSGLGEYSGAADAGDSAVINLQFVSSFADYMSRVGARLGTPDRTAHYERLAREFRTAFIRNFWDDTAKRVAAGNPESANAMAVALDLVPGGDLSSHDPRHLPGSGPLNANRQAAAAAAAAEIEKAGHHLQAGIYGSRYEFMVLADHGFTDTVLRAVTVLDPPGYAAQIAQGATSLWETWTGVSVNHHYRSTVATWFYQGLAGIRPTSSGYATIRIRPIIPSPIAVPSGVPQRLGDDVERTPLNQVSASIRTRRGLVASAWERTGDGDLVLDVEVPPNTPAEVWLPGTAAAAPPSGTRRLRRDSWAGQDYLVYAALPGRHRFRSSVNPEGERR